MSLDVNNIPEQVKNIGNSAPLAQTFSTGARILVLGEGSVGKTTLISACIDQPLDFEDTPAHTIKFTTNTSSITIIKGLYASNRNRGHVWKSVVAFLSKNKIDVIWFCIASDFMESGDEMWHWVQWLSKVCKVILVRTKCISTVRGLREEVAQHFSLGAPPIVPVLARDMQLNPKGGGAIVDAYGLDDLANITEDEMSNSDRSTAAGMAKLQKQAIKDAERYAGEEAHKGTVLNSLRSLSGTGVDEESTKTQTPNNNNNIIKDSLGDDDFELIPRPESPGSGFVNMIKSKPARTAVGALVAFAVIQLASNYSS